MPARHQVAPSARHPHRGQARAHARAGLTWDGLAHTSILRWWFGLTCRRKASNSQNGRSVMISRRISDPLPMEADPVDWADQQRPESLPEDEYPHADELEDGEPKDLSG
jgi:hypothetical protein